MEFAVHYSRAAASLVDAGEIAPDRFKCPAWPDLIAAVQARYPLYVHFPLRIGSGRGDAIDTETKRAANWRAVETFLEQTGTPFVNLHLEPMTEDFPTIPADTTDPAHIDYLTEWMIRDTAAVVARFGAERVIAENVPGGEGCLRPAYLPAVVRHVVTETGCGLLFDLSHARRAARTLGMDAREYIAALPIEQTCEIHITGIQHFDARWEATLRAAGIDERVIRQFAGQWQDHLPFTEDDWAFTAWACDEIRHGAWGAPWMMALEYGGVGPLWEAIGESDILREQTPRLHAMVRAAQLPPPA